MPASKIRRFHLAAVGSTGVLVSTGAVTLHGWALTETGAAVGKLEFRTPDPTPHAGPGPNANAPIVTSPLAFERTLAASTDVPVLLDHVGVYFPEGLFVDATGSSAVTGDLFIS